MHEADGRCGQGSRASRFDFEMLPECSVGNELLAVGEARTEVAQEDLVFKVPFSLEVAIGVRSHMEIVRLAETCASLALRN